MATTSEQRKQFADLRRAGKTLEEAKATAYGNVAPVSPPTIQGQEVQPTGGATLPIAPTVTPTAPTTPINPTTTPAPMAQAPVNPETGLSAPQVSTPTTVPTPEIKTEIPVAPTVDPVQIEREKISAQNKATLEQNRQKVELERQNKALDAQALIPTDQKSIVRALASGVSVPVQNTPEYRNAQATYKNFQRLNAMTDTELATNMSQGNIGTEMDSLLANNPNYQKAKQELSKKQQTDSINRMMKSIGNVVSGKEPVDLADLSSIERKYSAPIGANEQAYTDYVTNNQDVKDAGLRLKKISTDISEASTAYNDALKDLKKSYAGKLSASGLLTLMSSRTNETKELIDSLVSAKTLASGDFDMAMKMAEGQYNAVSKDITAQQSIEKEQRDAQTAREQSVFDANLGLQTSQAEFDQKIAQQAQTMGTPELAIPSVIEQYANQGIMASVSPQEHIQRAKAFIAQGGTLGEYISQMQKDFQAKPEYKAKFGKIEAPTTKEIDVNGQKVTVQWDGKEWTPVQGATIERELAKQKYGTTPAVRNFNPGNIMDTGFGGRKVEGERFTVFDTPSEGFNALVAKIQNIQAGNSKVYSPDMTLLQYISKYAPSSDNNNPQGYATAIANNLGISIDTKIGQIDPVKLAEEHARHEDGNSYKMLKDLGIIGGGTPEGYSETQKNIMSGMDAKNLSTIDQKILAQNGLQADDVYNYKASLKQGKWSQGLDDTEYKRVNTVIDDLAQDQVTKTFKKSQEAYNFATKVAVGDNATDNQALIYAFAKAMDPDSVVREGEYATVQKYSQTWGQKFGMDVNRILNGQEFISEEAKKNIVNTIKSKYGASKDSYESLRNTKIKMINDIAGKDIGSLAIPSDVMEFTHTKSSPTFDLKAVAQAVKDKYFKK